MASRKRGWTGPTGSIMTINYGSGNVGFITPDPAYGARVTSAPSYYERHERWKQNLSEEDYKALIKCILLQHYKGARLYKISEDLVQKLKCPSSLQNSDLNWLKKWHGYDFYAKQVHSQYLATLVNR